MREPPKCPHCDQPLKPFEGEGFDWVCTCHNNFRSNKPYAYYWNGEFPRDAEVPVSAPVPERTNNDYAIEFGGYLATAAENYLDARNKYDEKACTVGADVSDDDLLSDHFSALKSAIYEFRKRRDRELAAPVPEPEPASRTVSSGMVRYESMLAEARKDELGTCDLAATPHAKDSKLVQCGPCKNWTPVAPQASPGASKEMVILRPCKCGHGWESHEPGRCNESGCRCEGFRPEASPEALAKPAPGDCSSLDHEFPDGHPYIPSCYKWEKRP